MSTEPILPIIGIYRHSKGDLYEVTECVQNSTNSAGYEWMVRYNSLNPNGKHCGRYVRSLAEFTEEVEWPDGIRRPRFSRVYAVTKFDENYDCEYLVYEFWI